MAKFFKVNDTIYIDLERVESFSAGYMVNVTMFSGDKHTVEDQYVSEFLNYFSSKRLPGSK